MCYYIFTLGDISQHFNKKDFLCRCGQCDSEYYRIHLGLLGALEAIGGNFRRTVNVLAGYLCEKEVVRRGSGVKSVHRQGRAAHIRVDGVKLQDVYKFVETLPELRGIGLDMEQGYVHVDTRREDRSLWVKEGGRHIPLTDDLRSRHGLA